MTDSADGSPARYEAVIRALVDALCGEFPDTWTVVDTVGADPFSQVSPSDREAVVALFGAMTLADARHFGSSDVTR